MSRKTVTIRPQKTSNHGGPRQPVKLRYGTQRLLKVLWEQAGGPAKVSRLFAEHDLPLQRFLVWRLEGKVSLRWVGKISRKLKLPPLALNFEEVADFLADRTTWNSLVRSLPLSRTDRDYVLEGEPPNEYKGD